MKNETARREIESLDFYLQNHTDDYSEESHTAMMMAIKALEQEPKTGHWIRQDNTKKPLYGWYFCSECNSVIGDKPKFCSNCGARMEDKE